MDWCKVFMGRNWVAITSLASRREEWAIGSEKVAWILHLQTSMQQHVFFTVLVFSSHQCLQMQAGLIEGQQVARSCEGPVFLSERWKSWQILLIAGQKEIVALGRMQLADELPTCFVTAVFADRLAATEHIKEVTAWGLEVFWHFYSVYFKSHDMLWCPFASDACTLRFSQVIKFLPRLSSGPAGIWCLLTLVGW